MRVSRVESNLRISVSVNCHRFFVIMMVGGGGNELMRFSFLSVSDEILGWVNWGVGA